MDLKDAYRQVIAVLSDPIFLRGTLQILEKERKLYQAERRRYNDFWSLEEQSAFSLLTIDAEIIDRKRALITYFQNQAISKLPKPAIISADDLQDVAASQLSALNDETRDMQLRRFIHHVLLRLQERRKSDMAIDLGEWTPIGFDADTVGPQCLDEEVFPIDNGFFLDVEIEASDVDLFVNKVRARGFVLGTCTDSAARQLTKQIAPIIESLVRSLKLASTRAELEPAKKAIFNPDEL